MITFTFSERDIEDILSKECSKFLGVKFLARQLSIPVGIIDLLVASKINAGIYYVVEIKKGLLDPSAYVQVLRYSKWLNSEYSKEGKRRFIPVLVGEHLSPSLDTLVDFFEDDYWSIRRLHQPLYRLFKIDPVRGISFDYSSTSQQSVKPGELEYCHISAKCEEADYLAYRVYQAEVS